MLRFNLFFTDILVSLHIQAMKEDAFSNICYWTSHLLMSNLKQYLLDIEYNVSPQILDPMLMAGEC